MKFRTTAPKNLKISKKGILEPYYNLIILGMSIDRIIDITRYILFPP